MKYQVATLVPLLISVFVNSVAAEEKIDVVLDNLKNPCGVAIQPETGHIFVADSAAGRVIRIVDGEEHDVITGSSIDVYGKGPKYKIGPAGIAFLDKQRLVVADSGFPDGEEYIRVFDVPDVGQPALDYDDCIKVGPLIATDEIKAEGNFYGIAVTEEAIFVTCNGDDTKGWVSKADIQSAKFGELSRFIATKEATDPQTDAPVAITISPGGYVVIGQMGEIGTANDSLLTFYNARTGEKRDDRPTGLHDITALTYSPKGHLYALDFAWIALEEGGLFRLDDDGEGGINPEKITSLDKPTAMAFGTDGSLYITLIGAVDKGQEVGKGQLIRLEPGL